MQEVVDKGVSDSSNPMGLAAAVLYLSCKLHDESITQKEIAEAAGITDLILRYRLSNLKSLKVFLKPD